MPRISLASLEARPRIAFPYATVVSAMLLVSLAGGCRGDADPNSTSGVDLAADNQPTKTAPDDDTSPNGDKAANDDATATGQRAHQNADKAEPARTWKGDAAYRVVEDKMLALTGAMLIDGTGAKAKPNHTVLIEDGAITAVGPTGEVSIPAGAEVRDVAGKSVTPGFVMVHEHMFYPSGNGNYTQHSYSFPRMYLAGGATTIRTGGSMSAYADLNIRTAITDGTMLGPDIDVTAPFLEGPGLPILQVNALSGPDDARRMIAYWAAEGATSYKTYMHISRAELGAVVDEAHRRKQKVTGHLCSVNFREAADLGIDNLEHGFVTATDLVPDKEPDQCPARSAVTKSWLEARVADPAVKELIAHLVAKGVAITSTLTVYETFTPGRPKAPQRVLDAMSEPARAQYVSTWQTISDSSDSDADWVTLLAKEMALEKAFVEAGGTLLVGTDPTGYGGVVAGYANQRAIELLVEAGFSIEQAVSMATLSGARYLGRDSTVGTIEVGKRADLVIVDGDLSADVAAISNVEMVFKSGVGYDSKAIFADLAGTVGLH